MKLLVFLIAALLAPVIGLSQANYKVYTSHPRLWLEEKTSFTASQGCRTTIGSLANLAPLD